MSDPEAIKPLRKVGRCEIFSELGRGGMATVHLGRLVAVGGFEKMVAVKQMHSQFAGDPQFVAMFLDEARLVARIKHPNVLPTLDLIEQAGELYIVMEYVQGVTLRHLFWETERRGEHIPVPVALRIVTGVLHGLHAAHEAKGPDGEPLNLVHRDVSPENIQCGVDGFARLLDFGMAKALGQFHMTQPGQVKGKLTCMAPEQVLGAPVTRQTDVFATGAVLWQALTGQRLIDGEHIAEVANNVVHQQFDPPSEHADVPKKLDSVVMRALERDTATRWASAEKMALALEAIGPLASHREVGMWIRKAAWERLAEIAQKVTTIDRTPAASQPATRSSQPGGEAAAAALIEDSVGAVAARRRPPPPPRPRRGPQQMVRAALLRLREAVLGVRRWLADLDRGSLQRAPGVTARAIRDLAAERPRVAVLGGLLVTVLSLWLVVAITRRGEDQRALQLEPGTTDFAAPLGAQLTQALAAVVPPAGPAKVTPPVAAPAPGRYATIAAGEFLMGCNTWADRACTIDEKPGRKVSLDRYQLAMTEVTVAEYAACVKAKVCDTDGLTMVGLQGGQLREMEKCNWGRPGRERHPINCLTWAQARTFCVWAGGRLPTEAEWERAAGGPEGWRFPNGEATISCDSAVMNVGGDGCGRGTTWPVGSKLAGKSPQGLLDLAGNVAEWVADWYDARYYRSGPASSPTGPDEGVLRVVRGGSWRSSLPVQLRTSGRGKLPPVTRAIEIGVRCARGGD